MLSLVFHMKVNLEKCIYINVNGTIARSLYNIRTNAVLLSGFIL